MWYPGHQSKALRQLEKGIGHIDLIRDARIPLTSTNPSFELSLTKRKRLVIFNKYDLADMNQKQNLIHALRLKNQDCLFTLTLNDKSVKMIVKYAASMFLNVGGFMC
jgi:ribosome biogenesis GTPase A